MIIEVSWLMQPCSITGGYTNFMARDDDSLIFIDDMYHLGEYDEYDDDMMKQKNMLDHHPVPILNTPMKFIWDQHPKRKTGTG